MSQSSTCRRIVLASRPQGLPSRDNFRVDSATLPELNDGEMLIANRLLSIDPAIRGFLDDRPSYLPPVAIGEAVRGMTLGKVVRSRNSAFAEGSHVRALAAWEEFSVLPRNALGLEAVTTAPGVALEHYMGALGATGLTAWIGLMEIGHIVPGETVLVSAAAGAVGHVAGQIAKLKGCRVIGLAGSADKTARLRELGLDAAIDYKREPDLSAAIRAACPDGVDVYFDNVGGRTLEMLLPLMRLHGRVVVCGMVSDYNDQDHPYGVKTLWQIVVNRLTVRGFLTYDHANRIAEAQAELNTWVRTGQLHALNNMRDGLEQAPGALIDLLSGRTTGKTLVRLPG
jgi:NADPH-dependent curcumin reductase CurA